MSVTSKIEWTDASWNPVRGCTKLSPGCKHCYAERFAERFRGVAGHAYEQGFDLRLVPEMLTAPFDWPKPKRVFVNSMSDLFHRDIPDEYIEKVVAVMLAANWHTYQVLTKRAERMSELLRTKLRGAATARHIWWGVSVEDRRYGLPRVEQLRAGRPAVSFLSIEPLLEDLGEFDLTGIDWVIVGGESGSGARALAAEWVRPIRAECGRTGAHFFFKQWGGTQKSRNGRTLDGRTFDDMPAIAAAPIPTRKERMRLQAAMAMALGVGPDGAA